MRRELIDRVTGLDVTWCQSPDRGLPCPDGIFFLHIDEKAQTWQSMARPLQATRPEASRKALLVGVAQVGASRSNFGDERYENAQMQACVGQAESRSLHLLGVAESAGESTHAVQRPETPRQRQLA